VVADRRIPEFAPEHEPHREGLRPDHHANQNSPSPEPLAKAGSAKWSFLQQLLREAALAIRAGQSRAAELLQELDQMAARGQEMAETIRSERARAETAEERARAAEEHAEGVEQRAQATIQNLVQRAEVAEGRLHAAQCWIEQVRSVVAASTDPTDSW
jgi:chromosome segregation ATPase